MVSNFSVVVRAPSPLYTTEMVFSKKNSNQFGYDDGVAVNLLTACQAWDAEEKRKKKERQGPQTQEERQLALKRFVEIAEEIFPPGTLPAWMDGDIFETVKQLVDVSSSVACQ